LWQPKHHDYSNHASRNKAYDKLVEKLKEVELGQVGGWWLRKLDCNRQSECKQVR